MTPMTPDSKSWVTFWTVMLVVCILLAVFVEFDWTIAILMVGAVVGIAMDGRWRRAR